MDAVRHWRCRSYAALAASSGNSLRNRAMRAASVPPPCWRCKLGSRSTLLDLQRPQLRNSPTGARATAKRSQLAQPSWQRQLQQQQQQQQRRRRQKRKRQPRSRRPLGRRRALQKTAGGRTRLVSKLASTASSRARLLNCQPCQNKRSCRYETSQPLAGQRSTSSTSWKSLLSIAPRSATSPLVQEPQQHGQPKNSAGPRFEPAREVSTRTGLGSCSCSASGCSSLRRSGSNRRADQTTTQNPWTKRGWSVSVAQHCCAEIGQSCSRTHAGRPTPCDGQGAKVERPTGRRATWRTRSSARSSLRSTPERQRSSRAPA